MTALHTIYHKLKTPELLLLSDIQIYALAF